MDSSKNYEKHCEQYYDLKYKINMLETLFSEFKRETQSTINTFINKISSLEERSLDIKYRVELDKTKEDLKEFHYKSLKSK